MLNVVSNENYAALLNAIMQQLGYPIPQKEQEEDTQKSEVPRSTKEILARAREWLETVSDDCGGC